MRSIVFGSLLSAVVIVGAVPPRQVAAQALTPNEKFVTQAYEDLLNRPPATGELSTFASQLDASALTRVSFAMILTASPEFLGSQVNDYYSSYLGRTGDPPSVAAAILAIQGGATFEHVQGGLLGSGEYFTHAGGDNSAFLDALYDDLLGRPIDNASRTALLAPLVDGTQSREQIASAVLASGEYRNHLVGGYFQEFLHRPGTPSESAPFVSLLGAGGTDQNVIDQIVGSLEYFQLAQAIPEPSAASMIAAVGLAALRLRARRGPHLNMA